MKEKKTVVTTDSSTSKTEEEKVCIPFCQFKVMIDRKVHSESHVVYKNENVSKV